MSIQEHAVWQSQICARPKHDDDQMRRFQRANTLSLSPFNEILASDLFLFPCPFTSALYENLISLQFSQSDGPSYPAGKGKGQGGQDRGEGKQGVTAWRVLFSNNCRVGSCMFYFPLLCERAAELSSVSDSNTSTAVSLSRSAMGQPLGIFAGGGRIWFLPPSMMKNMGILHLLLLQTRSMTSVVHQFLS